MDRISGLPQPIQHDILNFLEEREIARAAVLSKAWRSIVQSRPVLVLFQPRHEESTSSEDLLFMNHVDKSVQRLLEQNHQSIRKFSLWTYLPDTESWSHNLDRWIQQLVQAKLKLLSLHLTHDYVLPPFVLLSETITNLRLGQCDLGQCNHMRLPNLIELSLQSVTLSQDTVDQISSGCPNLEILRLIRCRGFSSICVSGLARLLEVELCSSFELDVKVVAPMLRVFEICPWHCNSKIHLLGCESTLRNLTLSRVWFPTEGLRSLVSMFLGLEELVLNNLYVESIEISNQKLLQLEVSSCSGLVRSVRIDAPNLRVLKYSRNNLPFDPVISSISPNCMIEIYASLMNYSTDIRRSYKDLVLKLSGLTDMKLILSGHNGPMIVCQVLDENVIKMIDDVETPMIQSIEMVRVTTHEQMADRFFDSCVFGYGRRYNTISIMSRDQQSNGIFLEALRKEALKEKKPKYWKCSLYDAEMIDEETTHWPPLHRSITAMGYKIARIKLHWI